MRIIAQDGAVEIFYSNQETTNFRRNFQALRNPGTKGKHMPIQIQFRRGTSAEHETFTGAPGEITVDTTNNTLRVHDGQTTGGTTLARADAVTDMTGTDYVVAWQSPTADNNYTWYRLYKSGWVEMGGKIGSSSIGFITVNMPIKMQDSNYSITAQCLSVYVAGTGSSHNYVAGKSAIINKDTMTQSSFQIYMEVATDYATWLVQGFKS